MKKMLVYIIVWGILLLSVLVLAAGFTDLMQLYKSSFSVSAIPIIAASVCYHLVLRRRLMFFENYMHELTHMIFSLLFFERIHHFYVSTTSGELRTSGAFTNIITASSPYFFPLLTLLLILVFPGDASPWFKALIPISYGVFLSTSCCQIATKTQERKRMGWQGFLLLLAMNFWISQFVFAWYADSTFVINQTINQTINQIGHEIFSK